MAFYGTISPMEISAIVTHGLLFITLYAEVFLLLAFFDSYEATDVADPFTLPKRVPSVAIIVPCYNEEKTVAGTIQSLLHLEYPKDKLSILVVDDGSKDTTFSVASQFCNQAQVQVFHKENGGKHSAMNFALHKTNAEIIGCLDADSFVEKNALRASIKQMIESNADAVTPAIVVHEPKNMLQLIQKAEYSLGVFIRRAFSAAGAIFITPGPLSLFKRDVIITLGGWKHAHGTEDLEMGLRLQNNFYKITNTPRSHVQTKSPDTIVKLYKQRVRWTYGFIMNALDYRHMFFNRKYGSLGMVLLPAAFFSIFTVIYFTITIGSHLISNGYNALVRYSILGVHMPSLSNFDIFFVNTSSIALLAYVLFSIALTLMCIGKRLSGGRIFALDVPLYLTFYGFLAPLWIVGAVARAITRTQAPWR